MDIVFISVLLQTAAALGIYLWDPFQEVGPMSEGYMGVKQGWTSASRAPRRLFQLSLPGQYMEFLGSWTVRCDSKHCVL